MFVLPPKVKQGVFVMYKRRNALNPNSVASLHSKTPYPELQCLGCGTSPESTPWNVATVLLRVVTSFAVRSIISREVISFVDPELLNQPVSFLKSLRIVLNVFLTCWSQTSTFRRRPCLSSPITAEINVEDDAQSEEMGVKAFCTDEHSIWFAPVLGSWFCSKDIEWSLTSAEVPNLDPHGGELGGNDPASIIVEAGAKGIL